MSVIRKISIFIVDDDVNLHELYTAVFENAGYRVAAEAYDGKEAIDIYGKMKEMIDVVLMDYRMPEMNGLEILRRFLKMKPDAKIILASADESVRLLAMENGACEFMAKPFRIDMLLKSIKCLVPCE